jgi:hypothetical protein
MAGALDASPYIRLPSTADLPHVPSSCQERTLPLLRSPPTLPSWPSSTLLRCPLPNSAFLRRPPISLRCLLLPSSDTTVSRDPHRLRTLSFPLLETDNTGHLCLKRGIMTLPNSLPPRSLRRYLVETSRTADTATPVYSSIPNRSTFSLLVRSKLLSLFPMDTLVCPCTTEFPHQHPLSLSMLKLLPSLLLCLLLSPGLQERLTVLRGLRARLQLYLLAKLRTPAPMFLRSKPLLSSLAV